jgi:hypothetical protein
METESSHIQLSSRELRCYCNTPGVKHALGIAIMSIMHHQAFMSIASTVNETNETWT